MEGQRRLKRWAEEEAEELRERENRVESGEKRLREREGRVESREEDIREREIGKKSWKPRRRYERKRLSDWVIDNWEMRNEIEIEIEIFLKRERVEFFFYYCSILFLEKSLAWIHDEIDFIKFFSIEVKFYWHNSILIDP